ncbi:hypothetical protein PTKIN_Ptkin11bG0052300 [Pterospermum kingtungense]
MRKKKPVAQICVPKVDNISKERKHEELIEDRIMDKIEDINFKGKKVVIPGTSPKQKTTIERRDNSGIAGSNNIFSVLAKDKNLDISKENMLERRNLSQHLKEINDKVGCQAWILAEDFNVLLRPVECFEYNGGIFDHCPALVKRVVDVYRPPKPFKFFNCWVTHPAFLETMRKSWDEKATRNPI